MSHAIPPSGNSLQGRDEEHGPLGWRLEALCRFRRLVVALKSRLIEETVPAYLVDSANKHYLRATPP